VLAQCFTAQAHGFAAARAGVVRQTLKASWARATTVSYSASVVARTCAIGSPVVGLTGVISSPLVALDHSRCPGTCQR
jgi:predicted alpha/beta hydrolase